MSFFNSEIVRAEMAEIAELQEKIYLRIFDFYKMQKDEKIDHVNDLQELLNKQKILYTRVSLSDDPQAKEMKLKIAESASMMGLPANVDMNIIFDNMNRLIDVMREQIDKMDDSVLE